MNWLDLLIIFVVVAAALVGAQRGFLRGVLDLLVISLALIVALLTYDRIGSLILRFVEMPTVASNIVGFMVAAAVTQGFLSLALMTPLTPLIHSARTVPVSRQFDLVLGTLPGLVKGLVMASAMLLLATLTPVGASFDQALAQSRLADDLLSGVTGVSYRIQERAGLNLTEFMVVTRPNGPEGYDLPYSVTSGLKVDTRAEEEMVRLVNQERRQHGLAPVRFDAELQEVARAHSEEMWQRGYFAHVSPVTGTPTDRLREAGIEYRSAGENLALAPSVQIAHRGLMRSDGHRANILSPTFSRIGVGAITTPTGSTMFTQEFAGP